MFVTGVSAKTVNKLKKAGVLTVEQALRCYPRKYQEFARFNAGMQAGTAVLVPGRVMSYLKAPYSRKVSFVFEVLSYKQSIVLMSCFVYHLHRVGARLRRRFWLSATTARVRRRRSR